MNFGNLGFTEILILVLILVLFFGARRIPEIGSSIGKGIKEFKKSLQSGEADERSELPPPPATGSSAPGAGGTTGEPKRLSQ